MPPRMLSLYLREHWETGLVQAVTDLWAAHKLCLDYIKLRLGAPPVSFDP